MDTDCAGDLICVHGRCEADGAPPPVSEPALVRCRKDTDCKHDRICERGECVSYSAPGAAPAVAQTPAAPAPLPAPAEPSAATAATMSSIEAQDLQSRRRAGRGLLVSGIVAFVLGGAMQGGWALEECWTTGTNVSGYNESCELTTLGSSLVIGGFILLGVGTAGIIAGAVLLSKAKAGLRQMSAAPVALAPYVDLRNRSSGVGVRFRF